MTTIETFAAARWSPAGGRNLGAKQVGAAPQRDWRALAGHGGSFDLDCRQRRLKVEPRQRTNTRCISAKRIGKKGSSGCPKFSMSCLSTSLSPFLIPEGQWGEDIST